MVPLTDETRAALARLIAYCIPGGEEAVGGVRGIKTTQRGEIRSSPGAPWNGFTAEEFVDATKSEFCWEARMGSNFVTSVSVTDAYEHGHGRVVLRKGPIQLKKISGPEADSGELQRYLAYVGYCPPMILNNPSLQFTATGPLTLRVCDRESPTGAHVEIELAEDGHPIVGRAIRFMIAGKRTLATPWSSCGSDPEEHEGLRVWRRMEASWIPPEGSFTYIRIELTSFTILR